MKILKNSLENELNLRVQKDFPIEGVEFIDITPAIIDSNLFCEIVDKMSEDVFAKGIDYLVLPESRGFIFGTPVANKLGIGVVPVRKKGKLPPLHVEKSFAYEKEYGKDVLELPKLINGEKYEGKSFYIIDDIYATGNTIKGIKNALEELGGIVKGIGVLMNIKNLNDNKDVFSLIDVEET